MWTAIGQCEKVTLFYEMWDKANQRVETGIWWHSSASLGLASTIGFQEFFLGGNGGDYSLLSAEFDLARLTKVFLEALERQALDFHFWFGS